MTAPSVTLLGATGNLGEAALPTFLQYAKDGSFKSLRLLTTRPEVLQKHAPAGSNVEIAKISYDDTNSIAKALENTDVFVSFLSHKTGEQAWKNFRDAVILAKPKIYIPSEFGTDYEATHYVTKGTVFDLKAENARPIREAGIRTIWMANGAFMPYFLSPIFGINGNTWTMPEDGNRPYAMVSLRDVGRYVVRVVIQAWASPETFPDKVLVYSEMKSMNEYADIVERVKGEKIERVYISRQEIDEKFKSGAGGWGYEIFASGQTAGMDFTGRDHTELLNPGHKYFIPDSYESFLVASQAQS